jgi:xanthine dehydrogenase YagR molybdenum-binding subunit
VAYQELPAVTSIAQGVANAFAPKSAGRVPTDSRRGDPERALTEAEIVIDRHYTTPVNNHNPMELNAAIASWEGDGVIVHSTTQSVFGTRRIVAHCFGLPIDKVVMYEPPFVLPQSGMQPPPADYVQALERFTAAGDGGAAQR